MCPTVEQTQREPCRAPLAKGTYFGSAAAVRQGSSWESGSLVVLGSEPHLQWFTLASRCWSCLLPGWEGRGGSVSPIPVHQCLCVWGMLFGGCCYCSLSLASGDVADRGWFSIARLCLGAAALSEAAGCQRSLSAGDAAGEDVEMPKKELQRRAVRQLLGPVEALGRG